MVFIWVSLKRKGAALKEIQDEMNKAITRHLLYVHNTGLNNFSLTSHLWTPILPENTEEVSTGLYVNSF